MITKELSCAAVEMNAIFENMSIELLDKIPLQFRKKIKEIESKDYKFEYDKTVKLNEQKLLTATKGILAFIYRDYLCDEREKEKYNKEYNKVLMLKEQEKREKYNPDDIFKPKTTEKKSFNANILPVEYKENSLFVKIFNKIKVLLKNLFNK